MAVHAPITGARSRAPAFPRYLPQREAIESEIEMHLHRVTLLVARLDRADGDCDLEDDDPSGDPAEIDADSDDGRALSPILPRWSVDQSRGPTNANEPHRQYIVSRLGLVRSPSGGWRRP